MPHKPQKNKLKTRLTLWCGGLFFMATAAGLTVLGVWQLNRATHKQAMVNLTQQVMAQPAVSYEPETLYPEWQPLELHGQFDTQREVVLESQLGPNQNPGYRVVTPLLLQGQEVLVDRGWIPREFTPDFLTKYHPTTTKVKGVVRYFPQRHGWLQGATQSYGLVPTLLFFDPQVIPQVQGVTRATFYLQAQEATHPLVKAFVTTPDFAISPQRHREYAFTWLTCASLWLACGAYYAFIFLRAPGPSGPGVLDQTGQGTATRPGKPRRWRQ